MFITRSWNFIPKCELNCRITFLAEIICVYAIFEKYYKEPFFCFFLRNRLACGARARMLRHRRHRRRCHGDVTWAGVRASRSDVRGSEEEQNAASSRGFSVSEPP